MKALVSASPLLWASRLLVAAGVAWSVLAGLAAGDLAARRTAALADEPWIVIGSNRDGALRAYSLRSDGSRLTRLLPGGSRLVPIVISRNGETVLYTTTWYGEGAMYASRAGGTGLRRLAKGDASGPTLSGDGRWLAFSPERGGIWIVRTDGRGRRPLMKRCDCGVSDWAPNGRSVVLNGGVETPDGDGVRERIYVLPLHGKRRVVARMGVNTGQHHDADGAAWSPDGRWIAYLNLEDNNRKIGLYLVRPNGSRVHRLVRGAVIAMAWSPDGKKLAFIYEKGQVAVVGADGRGLRRLPLGFAGETVAWSPDGQRLAVASSGGEDPTQIFVVGEDGRDLRRVTAEGDNNLIGWTTRAPVLPPATPIPPSERVLDARSVATATPVAALSADGTRVAFVPNARAADCSHAAVWTPGENSIARFVLPAPCRPEVPRVREIAVAGARVAWTSSFEENKGECSVALKSATLESPQSLWLHGDGPNRDGCVLDYYHARGDGEVLVFNDGSRVVRIGGGRETCQQSSRGTGICSTLRRNQAGSVDSVSGALIAVRRPAAVTVLDDRGQVVRTLPFSPADVRAARLDGGRLVVWRFSVLEVYDVATGARVGSQPVPVGFRLRDVDGGVAVLVGGDAIALLRLADGASRTLSPGRAPVLAELEPTGIYYSYATGDGGGRVAFLPRAEADPARRLG